MAPEDLLVVKKLTEAGYGMADMSCRGALYQVLEQLLKDNPEQNDEFVAELREILSVADTQENETALYIARTLHPFIKACPVCRRKPDVGLGYIANNGDVLVVCLNHQPYAVIQGGQTLIDAIVKWNNDEELTPLLERTLFRY